MPKLVAVTGATGFIGSILIQELIQKGWSVRALTRTDQPNPEQEIQWIRGDLDDLKALDLLVKDASVVIHCAATVRGSSFKEFSQVNIKGTENILSVLTNQKFYPRFLLISSLAARQPELSWYAHSKYLSEQKLINFSNKLHWVIFRPTAVYGPGDKELNHYSPPCTYFPRRGKDQQPSWLIHVFDLFYFSLSQQKIMLAVSLSLMMVCPMDSYQQLANLAEQRWKRSVRVTIPDKLIRRSLSNLMPHISLFSDADTGKVNELQHSNCLRQFGPNASAASLRPKIRFQDALTELA